MNKGAGMLEKVITVFGGSGFVGRSVVQALLKQGAIVRVASRHPDHALSTRTMGFVGQVTPIFCDIKNAASVERALIGADAAINLVGLLYEKKSQTFDHIHVTGIQNIATAAKALNVSDVIHVSALGIDGTRKVSYSLTKHKGEKALQAVFQEAIILRPSVIFGPDDQFLNKFASLACFSPFIPLIGGGATRLQPVYVGDVAQAILRVLQESQWRGKIIELGGPKIYSFKDLMVLMLGYIQRNRLLLTIPFWMARILGRVLQIFPTPLLTVDQVDLLQHDNILSKKHFHLSDLGLTPTAIEAIAPTYLSRYASHF